MVNIHLTMKEETAIMYYMEANNMNECSKDGCEKPVKIKGMCRSHYQYKMRKKKTDPCTLEWCDKAIYAKGLCATHYDRARRGLENKDPRLPKPTCAGPECERESFSGGFCRTHYVYHWAGKELKVINPWKNKVVGNQKLCRTCEEWKTIPDDFYTRTGGEGFQGECKVCHIKRSTAHRLRKQALKKEMLDE